MEPTKCSSCGSRNKSVFCDLSEEEFRELDSYKICNVYEKGQNLFVQDTPVAGVFCISSGKVKLVKISKNGTDKILRLAQGGDVIGHRSLLSHTNYQATATALEQVKVCFFDKTYFKKVLTQKPSVSLQLLEKLSQTLGESETRLGAQDPVKRRVAGFLLYLNRFFGVEDTVEQRRFLDIKLTREEMASIVGTAPETLIRSLSAIKKDGIIDLEAKNIFIKDLPALIDLVELYD